jgi:hypothetical protein
MTADGILSPTIVDVWALVAEIAFVAAVVGVSVLLHAFAQRRLRSEMLKRHNDVAGFLFSAVGVLYAVVLGFVVVIVWQKYDATVATVANEVDAVGDLYHIMDAYPAPVRDYVREELRAYADKVVQIEWPSMERGKDLPKRVAPDLEAIGYSIDTFDPRNFRELAAQQAAMAGEQRLFDARRARLIQTVPAVPSVLWFALIVGAIAMVTFCFIFGMENRPAQLVMTAILVGLIGILFVVINEFSTPFSGSVRISDDGWVFLEQHLREIR